MGWDNYGGGVISGVYISEYYNNVIHKECTIKFYEENKIILNGNSIIFEGLMLLNSKSYHLQI